MNFHFFSKFFYGLTLFFLVLTGLGWAQANDIRELSTNAQVSLITAAPGNQLYTIFGHTALRVVDPANDIDRTYNYGTFDFDTDGFYRKFALGNLQYFLSVTRFENAKHAYLNDGRTITEQRLNLSPEEVQKLFNYLQTNARPENRSYSYEFFYDNCTTRVYEAIKAVIGDALQFQEPLNSEQRSFRQFINRYLQPISWTKFGINLLLGMSADRISSGPQTLFLPDLLKEGFTRARIQRADSSIAFVGQQKLYAPSNPAIIRPPLLTPIVTFWVLLGIVVPLGFLYRNRKTCWNWFDGLLFGMVGMAGVLILFLWLFSSYPAIKWNWNILWTLPAPMLLYILVCKKDKEANKWRSATPMIAGIIILGILFLFIQQSIPVAVFPVIILMIYRAWIRFRYVNPDKNLADELI